LVYCLFLILTYYS